MKFPLRERIEELVEHVSPDIGQTAFCEEGDAYDEWAVLCEPEEVERAARYLFASVARAYLAAGVPYRYRPEGIPHLDKVAPLAQTLYWRCLPEVEQRPRGLDAPPLVRIYMRLVIVPNLGAAAGKSA